MYWEKIEREGKMKYNLDHEWKLCGADASDAEVIKVEFRKKDKNGNWLAAEDNLFHGYVLKERVVNNEIK